MTSMTSRRAIKLSWPPESWFADTFGFPEDPSYAVTQARLHQMQQTSSDPTRKLRWLTARNGNDDDNKNESIVEVQFGTFTTPTVQELRTECAALQDEQQQRCYYTAPTRSGGPDGATTPTTTEADSPKPVLKWHAIQANVLDLHADPENARAVFQAASQFNCLEFPSPRTVPEAGITNYVYDRTQGPACAMTCGAGTAYRNYLVPQEKQGNQNGPTVTTMGQQAQNQLNTLQPLLQELGRLHHEASGAASATSTPPGSRIMDTDNNDTTAKNRDWPLLKSLRVKNGYLDGSNLALEATHEIIAAYGHTHLLPLLQVGVQADTQVTYPAQNFIVPSSSLSSPPQMVTQVYASAVPVAYSVGTSTSAWQPLAQLVLNGLYEATLLVALRQSLLDHQPQCQIQQQCQSKETTVGECDLDSPSATTTLTKAQRPPQRVFLTFVGGGVFGNRLSWIWNAMRHAHHAVLAYGVPLEIYLVHYGSIDEGSRELVQELNN
ncbi:hypothetical protein ACA910_006273 [Epithemia clementina (nom. ined.)]